MKKLIVIGIVVVAVLVVVFSWSSDGSDAEDMSQYTPQFADALVALEEGFEDLRGEEWSDSHNEFLDRLMASVGSVQDAQRAVRVAGEHRGGVDVYHTLATHLWHKECLKHAKGIRSITQDDINVLESDCPHDHWEEYLDVVLDDDRSCGEFDTLYQARCDPTEWRQSEECTLLEAGRDTACTEWVNHFDRCEALLSVKKDLPTDYWSLMDKRLRPCLIPRVMAARSLDDLKKINEEFRLRWFPDDLPPEVVGHIQFVLQSPAEMKEAVELGIVPSDLVFEEWEEASETEIQDARTREEAKTALDNAPHTLREMGSEKLASFY